MTSLGMATMNQQSAGAAGAGGGGGNPFWVASNWYAEKMPNIISTQLTAAQQSFTNQNINAGQFLRGVRFIVRSTGGTTGPVTADNPANLFASMELDNVDGANIMFPMTGYAYMQSQAYFRPWNGNPTAAYDYAASVNPSMTMFLQPEIRHTAGVLSNTDSRNQFKYSVTLATATTIASAGTAPTVTVTPFMDAWAQPDAEDLEGVPNQPLPPGLNIQTTRRHEIQTLQNASSDNIYITRLTGNLIRGMILILRDSNNARQDYATDPIRWTVDNKSLGAISPDELFNWNQQFYGTDSQIRPTGVYVYSRFFDPGNLKGQGWLPTNSATKLQWEFTTSATGTNLPGTIELITDEVIPVGPIPSSLVNI